MALKKIWILPLIIALLTTVVCSFGQSESQPGQSFVTATPAPTATPYRADLSTYHPVMTPAFSSDIDMMVDTGITLYKIEALLVPESLPPPATPKIIASMTIRYTNTETVLLNQVYFRLFPNTPAYGGSMTVTSVFVECLPVQTLLVSDDSALFVPLHQALEPGQSVIIHLTYETTIPTQVGPGNGLYAYDQEILALAGFYPTIPVFDHNGWHLAVAPHFADATYTDIALYDVTLTVPTGMILATSGTIIETTAQNDGTKTARALSGPMRDFFIVMSPTYMKLSRVVGEVTVNSYFPEDYEIAGEFALDVGANALAIFSDIIGPYPYREFDLAAVPVPSTLGGVEYPGVTALAWRYYLDQGNPETRRFMEFVTAHEVAHQWWYGLVGNDQVTDPWLDEALTQYTTVHYFENRYGPEKRTEMIDQMFSPFYWQLQDTNTNRPVFGSATSFQEALYYPVIYGKGPLFFEAVRNQLGDEAYFASLRQYAQQYRYGLAQPEDLLNLFAQVSGQNVEGLYRQWILTE